MTLPVTGSTEGGVAYVIRVEPDATAVLDDSPGVTPDNPGNPDLEPEKTTEIEFGFDASLFEGRFGIEFTQFSVTFRGENNDHEITFDNGKWNCECSFFASHDVCSHTMALERILDGMIQSQETTPEPT